MESKIHYVQATDIALLLQEIVFNLSPVFLFAANYKKNINQQRKEPLIWRSL